MKKKPSTKDILGEAALLQSNTERVSCSTKCYTLPTTGASCPTPMLLLTLLTFHALHNTYCRNLVRSVTSYFTDHICQIVCSTRTTCLIEL